MTSHFDPVREPVRLAVVRRLLGRVIRLFFRLEIVGAENLPRTGPVMLAGNHTGFLDGPIVMITLARPSSFLVKSELWNSPFRPVLAFSRQIPIRRGKPDRTALRQALAVLRGGGVLGMFPEGTRGSGSLASVQHGIGYLALRAGCPVVPVVCLGTAEALPKGRKVPRFRAPVRVVFGTPFSVDVPGDPRARSTVAAAAEQVRVQMLEHLQAVAGEAA